ncbi:MAG: IS200/IS605 family transposase [Chloroflexi bacterium]|nr:IS200/IS605 family transposase [Chloroflexota bacterium]
MSDFATIFYHVWFSPKRRKWLLQGDVEILLRKLLPEIAKEKGIKLLASELMVDHVHLLLELNQNESLSKAINLLKGVTARRVFQEFPELKFDAGVNHFWQKRYGRKEVPPDAVSDVTGYIQT